MASLKINKVYYSQLIILLISNQCLSETIESVAGDKVSLPCNISSMKWSDSDVLLILWYRGSNTGIPIYKVDARHIQLSRAKHILPDDLSMSKRYYFDVFSSPPSLKIYPVQSDDAGEYRCRVDHRNSRTQTAIVELHVIAPPKEVIIKNTENKRLEGLIGPYNEYSNARLICEAKGNPSPSLIWYHVSVLEVIIDDSFVETENGWARNEIDLRKLDRKDFMSVLTCRASSHALHKPIASSVIIDMNLKPLNVLILTANVPLIVGNRTQFRCRSDGSRPAAKILWQIDAQNITNEEVINSVINSGNTTFSIMSFTPSDRHNGQRLSCRAINTAMPHSTLEDKRVLDVHFLPQIHLAISGEYVSKSVNYIMEDRNITLECRIRANPSVQKIEWTFNGQQLLVSSNSVKIANHSLLLQRVRKRHSGTYRCKANNYIGQVWSEQIAIVVQFAPVCKTAQKRHYDVSRNRVTHFRCDVDAQPNVSLQFNWFINSSSDMIDMNDYTVVNESTSIATFVPKSIHYNYGVLLCFAENVIGKQREPCSYRLLIKNGPPESVANCAVNNHSLRTILVGCVAGDNGGLQQIFFIEVYENADTHALHSNVTSAQPLFTINDLKPETQYILKIYAFNEKGRSDSVTLTYSPSIKRITKENPSNRSLNGFIGLIASLVVVIIFITIIIKIKAKLLDLKSDDIEDVSTSSGVGNTIETVDNWQSSTQSLEKKEERFDDLKMDIISNISSRLNSFKRITNRIRRTNCKTYELENNEDNQNALLPKKMAKKVVTFFDKNESDDQRQIKKLTVKKESSDSSSSAVKLAAISELTDATECADPRETDSDSECEDEEHNEITFTPLIDKQNI